MRRIKRTPLTGRALSYLRKRQKAAWERDAAGTLDITAFWKSSRETKVMAGVLATLQSMAGETERCMYCVDSHGSDIDHFRPKAKYLRRVFSWSNMILCCTECGRIKGEAFPVEDRRVLLIDPTRDDPWKYLDFDPLTGNLSARFDPHLGVFSRTGLATVNALHLDRRGALQTTYKRTFRRLARTVEAFLANPTQPAALWIALLETDDHGLLGWIFDGTGGSVEPFATLRTQQVNAWAHCANERVPK